MQHKIGVSHYEVSVDSVIGNVDATEVVFQ